MRVFRRRDIAAVRVVTHAGAEPVRLEVARRPASSSISTWSCLNLEVHASDLPLAQANELLYRFGRGYPSGWDAQGHHCTAWPASSGFGAAGGARAFGLGPAGGLPPMSPSTARRASPRTGPTSRAAGGGSLRPRGALRYRQIEYYRMPLMAYLAVDDPRSLAQRFRAPGHGHLAAATAPATPTRRSRMPSSGPASSSQYLHDRSGRRRRRPRTRYLCSGHSLVVVGDATSEFFSCGYRGVLAQFRHQHFLLFLIAHLQKAALLMFSTGWSRRSRQLDVNDTASVKRFKRSIRTSFEGFLRFTHRYWFHEISEQAHVRALFRLCAGHLELDPLYAEVKERIGDMSNYLDADSLRRQASHRGPADGGHDPRPDRHHDHRLPRHEPARRGRRAAGAAGAVVYGRVRADGGAHRVHDGQVKRLSDFLDALSGRAAQLLDQGQGARGRVAARVRMQGHGRSSSRPSPAPAGGNPRAAASLVVVRDAAVGIEVLLLRRAERGDHNSGAWVSRAASSSRATASAMRCAGLDDVQASARLAVPRAGSTTTLGRAARVLRGVRPAPRLERVRRRCARRRGCAAARCIVASAAWPTCARSIAWLAAGELAYLEPLADADRPAQRFDTCFSPRRRPDRPRATTTTRWSSSCGCVRADALVRGGASS